MKRVLGNKSLLIGAFTVCMLVAQAAGAFAVNMPNENSYRVEDIAHRGGAAYAPENTMAAFMNAFLLKADFFELDVAMTKDGVLVVIHDDTVNRTTNWNALYSNPQNLPIYVKDLTYEQISTLDAGSWFPGGEFVGEHVPTLGEVLDAFRGKI